MKLIALILAFFTCHLYASSQSRIGTAGEHYYRPEGVVSNYTSYMSRVRLEDDDTIDFGKIERQEFVEGLLTRHFFYHQNRPYSTEEYIYSNGRCSRLTVNTPHAGKQDFRYKKEVYQYTYDSNGHLIETKGYAGKKLI